MDATCEMERHTTAQDSKQSIWVVFEGRNLLRFIISGWPKITQQFVGLAVFNTYATYFCKSGSCMSEMGFMLMFSIVQAAGNKDPFLVTLILSSVQLISMILTSTLTDSLGRRPLTVYPYAVTVVSVLCLGIIGCFDYTAKATSSLLVSLPLLHTLLL
jgi:SP family general alpha glucoside:H+ symporter-like MFS transporter